MGKISRRVFLNIKVMKNYPVPLAESDYYPVSVLQRKEFISSLLRPDYHFNTCFSIPLYDIDEGLFTRVILSLVERHESLRTIFCTRDGIVVQKIYEQKHPDFAIGYMDLIHEPDKEEVLAMAQHTSVARVFDFQKGPLLDVKLIKVTDRQSVLIFSAPHANCDNLSFEILKEEMGLLYDAYKEGKPNPLPSLRIQYKEYASWNNRWLESSDCLESKSYYTKKIGDSIAKERAGRGTDPFGRSYKQELEKEIEQLVGPEKASLYGDAVGVVGKLLNVPAGSYYFFMRKELMDKLIGLVEDAGTTLLPVMLSSIGILFYRVLGKRNLRIDVPVSTRDLEEFQNVVGWLMGGMIVCFDVDGAAALFSLIQSVTASMLDTLRHKYYPGNRILKDFDLPINQVSPIQVNLIKVKGQSLEGFSPIHKDIVDAYYHFGCAIREYDNGMLFSIIYNKSIFTAQEIEDMTKTYMNIIGSEGFELENTIDRLL